MRTSKDLFDVKLYEDLERLSQYEIIFQSRERLSDWDWIKAVSCIVPYQFI